VRGLTARPRNQPSLGESASGFRQGTPFQPSRLNRVVISQCPATRQGSHASVTGGNLGVVASDAAGIASAVERDWLVIPAACTR
jgi:hypothetical protein